MGQRTVFYQSRTGQSLSKHLLMDYSNFRQWLLSENRNSIQEFNERLISDRLERFLNENDSLRNFQIAGQEIIDELTTIFLLTFCDYGPGKDKFEIVGPMMGTLRYEEFKKQILKTNDSELKAICSTLDNGKSLMNDNPFITNHDDNIEGFWTADEQRRLEQKLKKMKSLFDKTEGVEYLISVLEETKDKNQELIIDIEK
ncbi:MAG: hypothetical protein GC181_02115 [Bacteroidetes bacterium]|nr:hypothetical protein [Bacteroidota bacterium]